MKKIVNCLHGSLEQVMQKVVWHQNIHDMLQGFLADSLKPHCAIRQFENGCLTIAVSDPVWLTLLRYQVPALRTFLRQEKKLYQLVSIELVLQPDLFQGSPLPVPQMRHKLSEAARDTLQTSSDMIQFEPLARALKRLGSTHE